MTCKVKSTSVISAVLLALLLAVTFSGRAAASPIFSDNFDSENSGNYALNYNNLTNWDVTTGSVDLIGQGSPFDFFPGNGLYLDMDGSTHHAGTIETKQTFNFAPGTYRLTFDLAGNHRGYSPDTLDLDVGTLLSKTYTYPSNAPYALVTEIFSVATASQGKIIFNQLGSDNVGMILDNVTLAPVPEPGTMMLVGAGFLGLAIYGKRRKNA